MLLQASCNVLGQSRQWIAGNKLRESLCNMSVVHVSYRQLPGCRCCGILQYERFLVIFSVLRTPSPVFISEAIFRLLMYRVQHLDHAMLVSN